MAAPVSDARREAHLTMADAAAPTPGAAEHPDEIAIYAGRQRIGYVIKRASEEWFAANDDDQPLGRFPSRKAAVDAILAAAARQVVR